MKISVVVVAMTLFVGLNLHEIAHTAAARAGGDTNAHYYLYHRTDSSLCIGCNIYAEERLSYAGNLAVTVAGVLVTQVVALGLIGWGSRQPLGSLGRLTSLLAGGTCALDAPAQVLQALLADVASQQHLTRVDLADTIYLVAQRVPFSIDVVKGLLGGATMLYFGLLHWLYRRGARAEKAHVREGTVR